LNRQGAKIAKFFKKLKKHGSLNPRAVYLGVFLGVLCALAVPSAVMV